MAAAKKKSTAKRAVKYAAKAQSSAKKSTTHAAHAAQATAKSAAHAWAPKTAAEWQKGASEWAKQSSKLYQLPFAQNEAADSVKSATENMVKMSTDMLQQLFSQNSKANSATSKIAEAFPSQYFTASSFDPAEVQEKFTSFAREAAEQLSKSASTANRAVSEATTLSRENAQAAVDVANVAVAVSKELSAEIVSYVNKVFSQNVELSKQALTCRTLNDLFDLSTRIMKTNLDGFFNESVKVSEMVFQCANDVSEPLNERVSHSTERLTKAITA